MYQNHAARPFGVTLIAILLALNGIVVTIQALLLLFAGAPLTLVVLLVFGLALLYLAYAMWKLQPWAWMATLVLEGLNALFAIISILSGDLGGLITLIIAGIIIFYLTRPEVHAAFGHGRPVT
ncbi:MAG TPA: hypothetical protein VFZ25_14125 [Chloroflexota bacterium]|nr:hypothetical protein [Chloroflexota bacterium]